MKLFTKFAKNIVAKSIAKSIRKKTGYKVKVKLNELDISKIDGKTNIHADIEINCSSNEFKKIKSEFL